MCCADGGGNRKRRRGMAIDEGYDDPPEIQSLLCKNDGILMRCCGLILSALTTIYLLLMFVDLCSARGRKCHQLNLPWSPTKMWQEDESWPMLAVIQKLHTVTLVSSGVSFAMWVFITCIASYESESYMELFLVTFNVLGYVFGIPLAVFWTFGMDALFEADVEPGTYFVWLAVVQNAASMALAIALATQYWRESDADDDDDDEDEEINFETVHIAKLYQIQNMPIKVSKI